MKTKDIKVGEVVIKDIIKLEIDKKYLLRIEGMNERDIQKLGNLLEDKGFNKENFIIVSSKSMDLIELEEKEK